MSGKLRKEWSDGETTEKDKPRYSHTKEIKRSREGDQIRERQRDEERDRVCVCVWEEKRKTKTERERER